MRWRLMIAAVSVGLAACTTSDVVVPDLATHHDDAEPWTSLEMRDGEERFHFAVVTDRTGGMREGVFPIGVDKLNLVQPAFVMSVGDLIEGYTLDRQTIEEEWDEFEGFTARLDAPFFYVAGNHDYMNVEMEEEWRERFGASYYHFIYKDTLFLVLNSEIFDINPEGPDSTGGEGHEEWYATEARTAARDAQFAYVEQVLEANPNVRWTFVFIHKPFWRSGWEFPPRKEGGEWWEMDLSNYPVDGPYPLNEAKTDDWTRMETLLGDRNYTAFAGHRHSYEYTDKSDGPHTHDHISLATTGGVSSLRGLTFGEFDHLVWVTMTEDGPVVANLLLDGVHGKDIDTPDASPWFLDQDD